MSHGARLELTESKTEKNGPGCMNMDLALDH